MKNLNKVKKSIDRIQENNLINGEYLITNTETGEIIDLKINNSKYKLKLSNNKQFMKKWTDRKLNIAIKKELSLLEKEILFDLLDYIDSDNIINFKLLALDYNYSPSKISKAKSGLKEKGLIKEKEGIFYLNPLVGIKTTEIPQDLIELFKESFEKYGIDINY